MPYFVFTRYTVSTRPQPSQIYNTCGADRKAQTHISEKRIKGNNRLPFRAGGLQFCQPEVQTGLPGPTPVPLGQIMTFPRCSNPCPCHWGSFRLIGYIPKLPYFYDFILIVFLAFRNLANKIILRLFVDLWREWWVTCDVGYPDFVFEAEADVPSLIGWARPIIISVIVSRENESTRGL